MTPPPAASPVPHTSYFRQMLVEMQGMLGS
jgi:hypothetical protein